MDANSIQQCRIGLYEFFKKNSLLLAGVVAAIILGILTGELFVKNGIQGFLFLAGINSSAGTITGILIGSATFRKRSIEYEKLQFCIIALSLGVSFAASVSRSIGVVYAMLHEAIFLALLIIGAFSVYYFKNKSL